jgi:hypothetical protein
LWKYFNLCFVKDEKRKPLVWDSGKSNLTSTTWFHGTDGILTKKLILLVKVLRLINTLLGGRRKMRQQNIVMSIISVKRKQ